MVAKQACLDELLGKMKDKGEEESEGEDIGNDSSGNQYIFDFT